MSVTANLVLGSDGSTRLDGDSRALSTPADREQFLRLRRTHDCIIIGGRTAATKDYNWSPCPVIVLSHTRPDLLDRNSKALWWNIAPAAAIESAKEMFGHNVGVEAGPRLLREFLELNLIDILNVSVSPISGGESPIELSSLLSFFTSVERSEIEGTIFYRCSLPR